MSGIDIEKMRKDIISETLGGIERSYRDLYFRTREDLLNYLKGSTVMDLGSGGGGFATDVYLIQQNRPELDITVYSVNPRLADPSERQETSMLDNPDIYSERVQIIAGEKTEEEILAARAEYKKRAVADSWDELHFPDEFFDKILSVGAYFFYATTYSKRSFVEIMRTLKPGGEFRASLAFMEDLHIELFEQTIVKEIESMGYKVEWKTFEATRTEYDGKLKKYWDGYISITK